MLKRPFTSLWISVCAVAMLGCGRVAKTSLSQTMEAASKSPSSMAEEDVALTSGNAASVMAQRKIIYNADIELIVGDFEAFEQAMPGLLDKHQAFIAGRSTDRQHGDHRNGRWTLRVPVENYRQVMTGIGSLGFAKRKEERTEDVTEAYVDLEARISNKQTLEARLVTMLGERSGKLSDLLELERELARVREEVERMQGRLRVLQDQTSLATIELTVSERLTYEPPAAPTLGDRIAMAWGGSLGSIGDCFSALVVAAVSALPWMALLSPIALIAYRKRPGRMERSSNAASA
ncbi:MAG: DUF4349 domain-containing protein [Planctomycetota bacterium]